MRKLMILVAAAFAGLLFSVRMSAQDTIVTSDNEFISAYISEIGDDSIVYKRADSPDGPNYRINTSRVVKIKFANGTEHIIGHYQAPQASPVPEEPQPQVSQPSRSEPPGEQVLFQPYAQPGSQQNSSQSRYVAPEPPGYVAPAAPRAQTKQSSSSDWRHEPLVFLYVRAGLQLGNATVPAENYNYRVLASYDLLDDLRIVFPSNLTVSANIGIAGRSARFDNGDKFFDTHGLLFGVRPGYTLRMGPAFRLSVMGGPYIYGDLWGRATSISDYRYLNVWSVREWNHFDAGISAGASFGIGSFMELYFEFRRGFVSFIKQAAHAENSRVFCFGLGFDF